MSQHSTYCYTFPSISEIKNLVETDEDFISSVDLFISNYLQIRGFYNLKQEFDKETRGFDLEHFLNFVANSEFDQAFKYISGYALNDGIPEKPVKDCVASLLQIHLINEISKNNIGTSKMVMKRINQVVKIFNIENGAYHNRVKNIHTTFKSKDSDVEQAKEKFIQYHRQRFSNVGNESNLLIPQLKTRSKSSTFEEQTSEELGGVESYLDDTVKESVILETSSSTENTSQEVSSSQNCSGSPLHIGLITNNSSNRTLPKRNNTEKTLDQPNKDSPKRKSRTGLVEESPHKKCKPFQYADNIVVLKEENFSMPTTPKRVPEFPISVSGLTGCVLSSFQGNTKLIFHNNNQLCFTTITKNIDGLFGIEESSIKDYKTLGLEKKNLSNGNLYLHSFGMFVLVGDTFIPKVSLLDASCNVRVNLEFVDFSFQKIRSFTPSSIDKNIWYLSSDQ